MWMVCAQPDGSMSSLLQSTGSSPYVLVHIVGPLAATLLWVDNLHNDFWCGKLSRQFCWWRGGLCITWIVILVLWPCLLLDFFLTDWKWGLRRSVRHRQHIYISWTRYRGSRKYKHCRRWELVQTLGRLCFWGCVNDYFNRNWYVVWRIYNTGDSLSDLSFYCIALALTVSN